MSQALPSMTDMDYEILSYLGQRPSCLWSEVLNAFDPATGINGTHRFLLGCLDYGLIERLYPAESPPQCRVRLTPDGYRALHLHDIYIRQEQQQQEDNDRMRKEEVAAKEAERDSDRRFQERLSTKQTVLAAILGAILSNLDRFLPWCAEIVQWLFALIKG